MRNASGAVEPYVCIEDTLLLREQIPDRAVYLIVTGPQFAIDFTAQGLK
jgi:hypothetical protein